MKQTSLDVIPTPQTPAPKGINSLDVKAVYESGLSIERTAKELDISPHTVSYHLDKLNVPRRSIQDYVRDNNVRATKWGDIERRILNSVCEEDLKAASFRDRLVVAGIAHDKTNVLTGQATERIDVYSLSINLETIQEQLVGLRSAKARLVGKSGVD